MNTSARDLSTQKTATPSFYIGGFARKPTIQNDFVSKKSFFHHRWLTQRFSTDAIYHEKASIPKNVNVVQAIKIACYGEQKHYSERKYSTIYISSDHSIFSQPDGTPTLPGRLGIPLLTFKLHRGKAWLEMGGSDNQSAFFLHAADAFDKPSFGFITDIKWEYLVGSVLVVRQDRKEMTPEQMQAVCEYCQLEVAEKSRKLKDTENEKDKAIAKEMLTPGAFKKWFEDYKTKKINEGEESWRDAQCPT